jgi:stringent starvation protein B
MVDGRTHVPMEYVRDGEIVLNIGPLAASRLVIGNEMIECSARFSGTARELSIPVSAVAAIYARENGQGMSFEIEKPSATPARSCADAWPAMETSATAIPTLASCPTRIGQASRHRAVISDVMRSRRGGRERLAEGAVMGCPFYGCAFPVATVSGCSEKVSKVAAVRYDN